VSEPRFLSREEIEHFHEESLEMFGGSAGLRDESGFLSAVEQPKNTFYYGHGDVFDVAAAYAFHLAQSQCFIDGNKRTGMLSTVNFLDLNGIEATFDEMQLHDAMIGIAEHRLEKNDLAALLRQQAEVK
jgi:death-on-curing protein